MPEDPRECLCLFLTFEALALNSEIEAVENFSVVRAVRCEGISASLP